MNQELVITWTPILKELPDDQRERARQLIEKYGEATPTNFIVELLEVFGIHAAYLQTVPTQVRIAGERAKAEVRQSIDAVTSLHERTRLELNEMVSTVSRTGASFTKALETAATAQVRATEKSSKELKAAIVQEFAKQNLPAITSCLAEIEDKAEKSLKIAERIYDHAENCEQHAKDRLATSERLCKESFDNLQTFNWCSGWVVSILCSIAVTVVAGFFMYGLLRSRSEKLLADKIAMASATIEQNKDAFADLAIADVRLKVQRSSDQTGNLIPGGLAILVENADAADMRDYENGKAGCIFVRSPTPEQELRHLNIRVQKLLNEQTGKK